MGASSAPPPRAPVITVKLRLDATVATPALLIGANAVTFAGIWVSAWLLLGSGEELVRWYHDGGWPMHVLLVLSILQLACGTIAALGHLRRSLPMAIHLGTTAFALFIGLAGSMVAVRAARAGIATAPPDLKLLLWGNALALADIPRQLGLMVAAWGMMTQVITSSINLWLRARQDASYTPTVVFSLLGAVCLTGGVVWTFATTPQAKLPTVMAILVTLVAGVLFCIFFAAAGARGARSPLAAYDPYWQAAAFSAAWLATVGMVCWAMALGDAAFGVYQSATFQRLVSLPPELAAAVWRVEQAPAILHGISRATTGIAYAAMVIGAGLLWFARSKFLPWVEVRVVEMTALLVTAALLWGTDLFWHTNLMRHHATLAAQLTTPVPAELDLPTSASLLRASDVPLLVLRNGMVSLNGRTLGRADEERTFDLLRERLQPPVEPLSNDLRDLPRPQQHPAAGVVALAMDRDTSLASATSLARRLHDSGIDRLKLVARERRRNPWPGAAELKLHDELELLGDFLTLVGRPKERAIDVRLVEARANEAAAPGPGPYVRFRAGEIVVVADDLEPRGTTQNAAAELAVQLARLKDHAPNQRRIRVDASRGQRWQDLIDLLDLARASFDADGQRRVLFDEPVWLVPKNRR